MFDSIYSEQLSQYYGLRRETLSESAEKHELCYLRRFDSYVSERLDSPGQNRKISSTNGLVPFQEKAVLLRMKSL